MSGMARYAIYDAYTAEELKRRYRQSDTRGRIALLQELYESGTQPTCEVALMAVEDPATEIRQWLARYGTDLEYTSYFRRVATGWIHERLDPSLYDRLRSLGDPFVNSCLLENPKFGFLFLEDKFASATHIERLALMRNQNMSHNPRLLKKLFACDDTELSLTTMEREELILAFLSNQAAIGVLEKNADLADGPAAAYRYGYERDAFNEANSLLTALWRLASQWPMDNLPAPVPEATFRYLPANDDTKAEIYEHCKAAHLRNAILESTTKGDLKTLGLGAADDDEDCRQTARWMIDRYHLHERVDAYPDKDSGRSKSILERWQDWRHRNQAIWLAGNFLFWVTLVSFGLVYTDKGNEIAGKLLDLYATWPGMIGFWVFVLLLGLSAIGIIEALCARYGWIYHIFWLGMIAGFYFLKEDHLPAALIAAFYGGSLVLPKVWESLSNELVTKIVTQVEVHRNGNPNPSTVPLRFRNSIRPQRVP